MRTVIIGDIHGEFDKLEELLIKTGFSETNDRLIFLGDLIDRGKDSYRVVMLAAELKKRMADNFIIIRGSHEELLSSDKVKDKILRRFVGYGATVRSFCKNGDDIRFYKEWFDKNTVTYYENDRFQCAHAAVKTSPIETNAARTLTMDHFTTKRNVYDGKLTVTGHIHLKEPTYFDGSGGKGMILSYGKVNPLPKNGVICIDTGCGDGGKLTCMIISGETYCLQTKAWNSKYFLKDKIETK